MSARKRKLLTISPKIRKYQRKKIVLRIIHYAMRMINSPKI